MKKNKAVIISCILIGLGVVMSVAGYISGGYKELKDRNGFVIEWNNSGDKNQSIKIDEQLEEFNSIDLNVNCGDVEIDEGDSYRIIAEYNEEKEDLSYSVKENKLFVTQKTLADIQRNIKIFDFENDECDYKIKVYVPKGIKLDELKLNTNVGDTKLKNLKCRQLVVANECGNVEGSNMEIDNFKGDLETCEIKFDKFTSDGMNLNVESGEINITGKLSGENKINLQSGSVNLKNDLAKEDCGYDIDVDFGGCKINGNRVKEEQKSYNKGSKNMFVIKGDSGSVQLDFNK